MCFTNVIDVFYKCYRCVLHLSKMSRSAKPNYFSTKIQEVGLHSLTPNYKYPGLLSYLSNLEMTECRIMLKYITIDSININHLTTSTLLANE